MDRKLIICVSFGSSYEETIKKTIDVIESDLKNKFKDYDLRRAFTSPTIIKKLEKRGIFIDSLKAALEKAKKDGYKCVYIQPTHLIAGFEYDKINETVNSFENAFKEIKLGVPLLNDREDVKKVCSVFADENPFDDDEALIIMGHGTEHDADIVYKKSQEVFRHFGYENIFVSTVEGELSIENVSKKVLKKGYKKAVLIPFMLVCGEHATNDMAGDDEDSWKNILISKGFDVRIVFKGMGEYKGVRDLIAEHLQKLLNYCLIL